MTNLKIVNKNKNNNKSNKIVVLWWKHNNFKICKKIKKICKIQLIWARKIYTGYFYITIDK